MFRFTKNKKTQRVAALALAATIAASVFVFGPKKKVQAAPINGESVNALYDDGKYNQGGKTVEVLRAVNSSGPYVYCVKASSALPVANGGAVNQKIISDSTAAQAVMGKVKAIIEMPNSTLEACSDWQTYFEADGQEGYIVRQLLIWNEIFKAKSALGTLYCSDTDDSAYFRGYDLSTLTSSGYPLVRVAKELANNFSGAGAYVPTNATYQAVIGNVSSSTLQLDSAKGVYYVTFSVTVKETHSGTTGGNFKFTDINGCNVYPSGSSTAVNTSTNYASGSTFRAEGTYSQLLSLTNGNKASYIRVIATTATNNSTQTRVELGFFRDSSDAKNQTFVAPYINSVQDFEPDDLAPEIPTVQYTLTKYLVHPDGSTDLEPGVSFTLSNAGYSVSGTTDSNGKITDWTKVPYGTYTLTQTTFPAGTKAMNPNPASVVVDATHTSGSFNNEEEYGYVQIQKKIQTTADKTAGTAYNSLPNESGAVFQIWNNKYASYAAAPAYAKDTLTTGTDGKTPVSKKLIPGTYNIHQTTASASALLGSDTTVTVTANNTSSAPALKQLTNSAYEQNIQITKVDESTGAVIPAADTTFRILKSDKTTVVKAADGKSEFTTNAEGKANITNLNLTVGSYYIQETVAPEGFLLTEELTGFTVAKGDSLISVGGFNLRPLTFSDKPVTLTLTLEKEGEYLSGVTTEDAGYKDLEGVTFDYSALPLEGAEFDLILDTDVKDTAGNFRQYNGKDMAAGTYLGTFSTDAEGKIEVSGLYLNAEDSKATYHFIETVAPKGFILNDEPVVFEMTDDRTDRKTPVITKALPCTNKRDTTSLTFKKVGISFEYDATKKEYVEVENGLPGAVFGIYAAEDVYGYEFDGTSTVPVKVLDKDALVEVVTSDDSGVCKSTKEYPIGYTFYTKELEAPEGYILDENTYDIVDGMDPIVNTLSRACVKVNKTAHDTKLPMENVTFEVWSSDGKTLIETIVTDKNGIATTKTAIPYGETVILRETKTDAMYELAADETIRINVMQDGLDEYGVQDKSMVNYRKAEISVVKVANDGKKTVMDDITYQLWKKGSNGKADELIATEKTDVNGEIHFFVEVGEYYLKETDVGHWKDFLINEEPVDVSASEHEKVYKVAEEDDYTYGIVRKLDAQNGALLGGCGISVKNSAGIVLTFVWNADLGGYLVCDPTTEGALTVLYTNNDAENPQYGTVKVLGLEAGKYQIFEVEAPENYRNDSTTLDIEIKNDKPLEVQVLYDTLKTAERDMIIGWCIAGVCGISAISLLAIAIVEFIACYKSRKRKYGN